MFAPGKPVKNIQSENSTSLGVKRGSIRLPDTDDHKIMHTQRINKILSALKKDIDQQ